MQITINEEIAKKLRMLPNPEAFVNSLLKEKLSELGITQKNLEEAVRQLMDDYHNDAELTAFTDLDGEDFARFGLPNPNHQTCRIYQSSRSVFDLLMTIRSRNDIP